MTDPDLADATYIEPITPEIRRQDHREGEARRPAADDGRADRPEYRAALGQDGTSGKDGVELIGASRTPSTRPKTASCFRDAMEKIGLECAKGWSPHHGRSLGAWRRIGLPRSSGPPLPWAAPAAASPITRNNSRHRARRLRRLARTKCWSRNRARLERIRDGGRARQRRQLHHHLLHRERRSHGHPHR